MPLTAYSLEYYSSTTDNRQAFWDLKDQVKLIPAFFDTLSSGICQVLYRRTFIAVGDLWFPISSFTRLSAVYLFWGVSKRFRDFQEKAVYLPRCLSLVAFW